MQADDEDRDRRGAGHEAAGESEDHDLSGSDLTIRKALLDIRRVRAGVRILVFEVVVVVVMVGLSVLEVDHGLAGRAADGGLSLEGMRFRDSGVGFPEPVLGDETEGLLGAVFADRAHGHGSEAGIGWKGDAEDRWHAVFEDVEDEFAVRGHERPALVVVMVVMMAMFFAQAHDRPDGHADNDDTADEEEVGLGLLDVPVGAILECEAGQDPDDERVREGGAEAEKGGLPDGPADGDDEGGHHGLRVAGLEAVQGA